MTKELINILFTILFLTIILLIILFIIYDSLSTFKKNLSLNKYDLKFKKELNVKEKELRDLRKRIYYSSSKNKRSYNLLIDASNLGNNNFDERFIKVKEYSEKKKKFKKRNKKIALGFNIFFTILILGIFSFSLYLNINNSSLSINDTTYVTIKTGSMSEKHKNNTYLNEFDLNDQIQTFTLIGLDKVNEDTPLNLYDICAYKDKDNKLIVHRIIKIENRNGTNYYTFRGDANETSDYYLVKEQDILYKANGYKSYPLGIIISFINSPVGLITIIYLCIVYACLDSTYNQKEKLYETKKKESIAKFNKEEIDKLGDTKIIYIK